MRSWLARFQAAFRAEPPKQGGHPIKGDEMLFQSTEKANGEHKTSRSGCGGTDFRKQLRWMIQRPPEGSIKMRVTPAMAEAMLEYNDGNRPLSDATVAKYAKAMSEGRWIYTAQTIAFSEDGRLNNGQHRLQAIVRSGAAIDVDVRFGEAREAFAFTDVGKVRTAGDIFAINGEQNYSTLAAAIRWVWRYENLGMRSSPTAEPDHKALHDYLCERHPGLREYTNKLHPFLSTGWRCPTGMIAINYLCGLKNKQKAEDFFYQLVTGNDIGTRRESHPVIRVRKRLNDDLASQARGAGLSQIYKLAFIAKGWNAWRADKPLNVLKWRGEQNAEEPFPRLK